MRALVFLLIWLPAAPAWAGLKVLYLRHAESGANVEGAWKHVPREQWPSYVGDADTFSPKGWEQLPGVVEKLRGMKFDFIAVSPLWRARNTILPYLRETGRSAEIWPELAEFHAREEAVPATLPPPSADLFTGGDTLKLPDEEKVFLAPREGARNFCHVAKEPAQAEADRRALTARVVDLLRRQSAAGDESILLVGHGNAGRLLAAALTGDSRWVDADDTQIRNASLWCAEEQADGRFRLTIFNDVPVGDKQP
jgi:broad specificity phosphatase PhoE